MTRYHTTGNTNHWRTPAYRHQSDQSARLEATPPFNHRKGTIRGVLAMISVFAALAIAWSMLP